MADNVTTQIESKTRVSRHINLSSLYFIVGYLMFAYIKKNQEHSRNSYHICGVAEGNYAAASCDQHIAASDACQAPIEGFSLMGVVRFLANKVKTQITGVLNYLLKERSYRLT